ATSICASLWAPCLLVFLFFSHSPPTPQIYTLSLHDALPISGRRQRRPRIPRAARGHGRDPLEDGGRCPRWRRAVDPRHLRRADRSEEHTSELQSHLNLVCRLLLEKKKKKKKRTTYRPTNSPT